jgi:Na+-transporting methylmalonyl-CoA/oxaloacetate decarboxylase beta subunit
MNSTVLLNAAIVLIITFSVLIALYFLVRVFSFFLGLFTKKKKRTVATGIIVDADSPTAIFSAGELLLKDCDEQTAAVIMAVVADWSDIPLERLVFRSIKLIQEGE